MRAVIEGREAIPDHGDDESPFGELTLRCERSQENGDGAEDQSLKKPTKGHGGYSVGVEIHGVSAKASH